MKGKILFLLAVCCLLIALTAVSLCAQWEDEERSRIGIGFSMFLPTNSNVDAAVGSGWFGPVVTYNARFDEHDRPKAVVNLAFLSKDGEVDGFDGSVIPLTYSMIKRLRESRSTWYAGGGVGVYFGKFRPNPLVLTNKSSSDTKVGIHALGGYEFGRTAFAEVRYDLTSKSDGFSFSGFVTTIGLRQTF